MTKEPLTSETDPRTVTGDSEPAGEHPAPSIRIETEALIAALIAGLAGGVFAAIAFWGRHVPIWGDIFLEGSVGAIGVTGMVVAGLVSSVVSYWRSRWLPEQSWRRRLPTWKTVLDAGAVALVHTAIAVFAAGTLFFVLQLAFRRLTVDGYTATIGVALAMALSAYGLYLAVSQLTTESMSQRLLLFMTVGVLLSMATSTDPIWWRYHFSHLGTFGDQPSIVFNATLIIAGLLVTTFALYVSRDIRRLARRRIVRFEWSARVISAFFIAMGIALAGIGLVPINLTIIGHNVFAGGTVILFGVLLLATPIMLWGMPAALGITALGFFAALAASAWLASIGYFNITAFELVAFVIMFGWIALFVRFVSAVLASDKGTGPSEERERSGRVPPTERA
ncbi:hypothetical protein GCM10027416_26350 [Okibacterium endophyticum]